VTANPDFRGIDGKLLAHRIHAGDDIAIVAAAEIFNVAPREGFPLAVTAARVWTKHKPAQQRGRPHIAHGGSPPVGKAGPTRTSMNAEDERVLL
jgi:hypothetical protein